jgi:hypothetical protein
VVQVVSEPIIPRRSRLSSESYLVTGLGVSHYISSFETEVAAVRKVQLASSS